MPYNYNVDYFRDHFSGWHAGSFPKITLLLETYLAGSTNLRVLDFGCGDGIYGPVLRPYASFLAGIEGSADAAEIANEGRSYDQVIVGDLGTRSGLQGLMNMGNFDVVFSTEVIEHIEEYSNMLALARSALKPGGRLILTTTMYYHFFFHGVMAHRSAVTPKGLKEYFLGFWSIEERQKFVSRFRDYTGGHYHGFSRRMLTRALVTAGFSLTLFEWLYAEGVFPMFPLLSGTGQLHEKYAQRGYHWLALAKLVLLTAGAVNRSVENLRLPGPNCFLIAQAV
jgi:2-polyprenyl-3-methyl-5-hydroxy-6-metoxy-1,4-benzoquinol methylase